MTWSVVPQRSTIATGRYEGFPGAVRVPSSGRIVVAWASQTDHYTQDVVRSVWSADDGVTWSAPVTLPIPAGQSAAGMAAMAARGSRVVLLMLSRPDLRAWVSWSDDGGVSWSAPVRIVTGAPDTWDFPSGLAWVEDGSTDGLLLATSYNNSGIRVTASKDRGATWEPWSQPSTAPWDSGPSETSIVQTAAGDLLMSLRWDEIHTRRSTDFGKTWTSMRVAVRAASGMPTMTTMPNGSIVMAIRRTGAGVTYESWGVAVSEDDGWSWRTIPVSDEWMMYGQAVPTSDPERALLVGSSQVRVEPLADVWSRAMTWDEIHLQSVVSSRPAPALDVYVSGLPADMVSASVSRVWRGRSSTLLVADGSRGSELRVVDHAMPVAAPPPLPPKIRVGYEAIHLGDGLYEFVTPEGYDPLIVSHDGAGNYEFSTVNGDPVTVRQAADGTITSVERTVQPEPLPELVRYTLEIITSGGSIVRTLDVEPALVADSDVWLSDPLDPRGAVLVTAMATDGEGMSWDSDGGVMAPMGGLAISTGQRRTRVRGWRLKTENPADYAGIIAMIDRGSVLLLRGDPDCLDHPEGVIYAHVESPRWGHVLPHSKQRWLTLTGREVVAPLASTIVAARSYETDLAEHPTYGTSLQALPTYLDRVRA